MANLTKKMYLENHNYGEKTVVVEIVNDCHLTLIREPEENAETFYGKRIITVPGREYVAGPIVDRLYEFESLGFEPEDIKAISKELRELIGKRTKKKVVVETEFQQLMVSTPGVFCGKAECPAVKETRYYRCPTCHGELAKRYKITKLYPNRTVGTEGDHTRAICYPGMDICSVCKQMLDWSDVDKGIWA